VLQKHVFKMRSLVMTSTSLTLRCIGRRADTHDVVSWQFAPVTAVSGHFWLTLNKSGKKVKILLGQTLLVALARP
jgi:hypothetical protein